MRLFTLPQYEKQLSDFLSVYEPYLMCLCPDESIASQLKDTNQRKCRFCRKSVPETTFNTEAHLIPHLMGNKYLVTDFECDNCNKETQRYEDHLAKFLGFTRTFHFVKGKSNKVPNALSPGAKVSLTRKTLYSPNDCIIISRKEIDESFTLSKDGKFSIKFLKQPYRPIWVYKSFLKMVVAALPEKDIANYRLAIDYLITDKLAARFKIDTLPLMQYEYHTGVNAITPALIIFRKRNSDSPLPSHSFLVLFKNMVFHSHVLLNRQDLKLYSKEFDTPFCPPIFFSQKGAEDCQTMGVRTICYNMASKELKEDDYQFISGQFDSSQLKNLVRYDPRTGVSETVGEDHFDNEIMKFVLIPSGTTIPLDHLEKLNKLL